MATIKEWVPYDQIVGSEECPGEEYISIDCSEAHVTVTGPDADGLVWISCEARGGGKRGAVSVRADSIAGQAFASWVKPAPSSPEGGEVGR